MIWKLIKDFFMSIFGLYVNKYKPKHMKPVINEQPILEGMGIFVERFFENEDKTLSNCFVYKDNAIIYEFKGIELPWRENKTGISRVFPGAYNATAAMMSTKRKYGILLEKVVGRTAIFIHIANYVRSLRGCLAPGVKFKDIDKDGVIDVASSGVVMNRLQEYFPIGAKLKVIITENFINIKPII